MWTIRCRGCLPPTACVAGDSVATIRSIRMKTPHLSARPHRWTGRIVAALALCLAFTCGLSAAEARRLEVLFLGDNGHHQPAERFFELYRALGPRGLNLTYTDKLADLNPQTLAKYDALMLYANWTQIEPSQEAALLEYVRGGHGFVPLHCASYCFLNSMRFTGLVGGRFKSHGTGVFQTKVVTPDHPIMKGFQPFETWDETYVHEMHNNDSRTVLQVRENEPYTWVRNEGQGRVFYTAYGHDQRTFTNAGFTDLVYRGTVWAAGEKAAAALAALNLKPFQYIDGAEVPNYERREPAPKLQAPLPAAEAQKHIYVPPDFALSLFASEAQGLWNVIEFKFDELGRLWTCESLDYPNEIKLQGSGRDRIRILEDTDGDGKADKATVFAEGLSIPTSLVFSDGGVIALALPDTVFLKDTNGDGRADEKKVLFTGWGTGDTHACPSSLVWGYDGWIYGCVGYSGFNGTVGGEQLRFGSGVYRFKKDGSKLEFLGGTSNNTWGFAFNENGDIFGSTANNQSSFYCPIPRRYYAAVPGLEQGILPGVDANKKAPYMREYIRQVDVMGGFTAAACHNFYTARTFPQAWWNSVAFVAEPTCHLLYQGNAVPQGTHFSVENAWNLMASDDEWFAPVWADVGPDGAVWVSDFYSFLIQHNPTPTVERGGFRARTGKGNAFISELRDTERARIWRVAPKDGKVSKSWKLKKDDPASLVEALASDNLLWRRHAQRLLTERGQSDVADALKKLVADTSVDAVGVNGGAFHAVWTLGALGALDAATLDAALKHPAQGVRRAAAQNLPRTAEGLAALEKSGAFADKEPLVRLTALLVASEMPSSDTLGATLFALGSDPVVAKDRWLPTALTIASAKHGAGYLRAALAAAPAGGAPTEKPKPVNLITNGDFETLDNAQPKGWQVRTYTGQAEHTVDAGRNGGHALKITSQRGSDTSWHHDVTVESETEYLISGWIKTENLGTRGGGRGAMLEIHQLNGRQPMSQVLKGNQDWTRVELAFNSGPQREISLNLLYGGWGHATGTAWWDDISLVKTGAGDKNTTAVASVASVFAATATAEQKAAVLAAAAGKGGPLVEAVVSRLQGTATAEKVETLEDLRATHQIIRLGVVAGQMKYDKVEIAAKAGKPIALVLVNSDEQPHNAVVGQPGTLEKLGAAANAMAAQSDGFAKQFIPSTAEVIAGSKLANKDETVWVKVPALKAGDYPVVCTFPGHWLLMRSVLKVAP